VISPCFCRLDQDVFTLVFGIIGAFELADDDEYLLTLQEVLCVAGGTSTALLEYLLMFSSYTLISLSLKEAMRSLISATIFFSVWARMYYTSQLAQDGS
jgi:hypothetical protein